jgi:SAM-dependent methyltransferase
MRAEWFSSWFDSPHYHRLYANRDDVEARRFTDALIGRLRPLEGSLMLDLGCGAGRHARHLASKGYDITGIDLSARSINEAKKAERPRLRFRRQDMRVPFGSRTFDYIFNFFTSFGYFEDSRDHQTVARNIALALKEDGRLVLDYLNIPYADAHLTPHEEKTIDGIAYRITRWVDGDFIVKRIVMDAYGMGSPVEHVERVARFTLGDFDRMLGANGLFIEEMYGDYGLGAFDVRTSPRLILVAGKTAKRLLPREVLPDAADGLRRHAQV